MAADPAPPVLFDIDDTLLDTGRFFRQVLWPLLSGLLDISLGELDDSARLYFDRLSSPSDFHPLELLAHLATIYQIELDRLREVVFVPDNVERCRFEDVLPAMDQLAGSTRLGIYSEGVRQDWQQFKLESLGVMDWLQPDLIFIEMRKLRPEVVAQLPPGVLIVDDKRSVVTTLARSGRVQPVLIDRSRGGGAPTAEQPAVPVITTLAELPELIARLHHQ
ncbi:MAG: hypothetical protein COU69_01255 [Candidatus Pacebacteria bacterium CG10_big_fil_rev_8_21_14_0_10_56_10]|nr:MAG: hypothetical protein COU69_01255 [Candidatus Pacebacteria bacterium CG10_big_fil_rev_8_21_14_0_10_56_10]